MIQRIQSIYLLLTTLLALLFLTGRIVSFEDGLYIGLSGVNKLTEAVVTENIESLIFFSGILILIPLISLVTIFMYKNRRAQSRMTIILVIMIIVEIFAVFYYSYHVVEKMNAELIPGFKLILPVLMLIFSFLAYRNIRKDEDLVKSYDRLR